MLGESVAHPGKRATAGLTSLLCSAGLWPGLAVGLTASMLIVAGGVLVGPQAGPRGVAATVVGYGCSYGGLLGLVGAWLHVGRLLRRQPGTGHGALLVVLLAWGLPLLIGPPLFSRDVFSYAAHGREIALGINPYHHGPSVLGGGPYLGFVSPIWMSARSPYGPLFLALDGLIVRHSGQHVMVAVAGLRLLSIAGVALLAVWLPRLAGACGRDPSQALWLGVLNPLVLLHVVSGGHNDGLMLGLLVAGLVLGRRGRFGTALVLCLLAAGVKAPAALGAVYVAADWLRSCPDRRSMARGAAGAAAVTATVATLLTAGAGLGWGWLGTLATATRVRTVLSPTTDIGLAAGQLTQRLGLAFPASWALSLARAAGLALAVLICAHALTRRGRPVSPAGLGIGLLAVVTLGPVIQPWYLLWGMVPLAAAGPGRLRPLLVWVSTGLSLLVLPNGAAAPDALTLAFLASVVAVALVNAGTTVSAGETLSRLGSRAAA
jgi:alpha-1,6-mannosyltransferase